MSLFDSIAECPNCGETQLGRFTGFGFCEPAFARDAHYGESRNKSEGIDCYRCGWSQWTEMVITTKPGRNVPRIVKALPEPYTGDLSGKTLTVIRGAKADSSSEWMPDGKASPFKLEAKNEHDSE